MLSFTDRWTGYVALAVFLAAYVLVIVEENIHLRKSKPVMVAAGAIWILTAIAYVVTGLVEEQFSTVTLTVKELRLLAAREVGDQFQSIEEVVG